MKVTIDGIDYIPAPPAPPHPGVLDAPMGVNDAQALTVREYLVRLLSRLWDEEEGFSGKRPFGNSGWAYELYTALVQAGIVSGTLDEDGDLADFTEQARKDADRQIALAILSLGKTTP